MTEQEKTFVAGAVANGIDEHLAREVFALIEPFAGYAFNKAHSVSYALVAYRGAYVEGQLSGRIRGGVHEHLLGQCGQGEPRGG